MILGLLGMAAANAAALLGAHALVRRIRTGDGFLDFILFLLVHLVLILGAVLAAGLAHGLTPLALGALGMVTLAGLIAAGEHRQLPRPSVRGAGGLLVAGGIVVVLKLALQVWFFAPYSVDPLSYHLPKVAAWIRQGALFPLPGADIRESFPAGFELLEAWWSVFLHHDALIELAGVELLLLGAASTAAIARHCGLGVRASLFAGLLYAVTPGPALQATACMNDGAVASLQLAALALAASRVHPALTLVPLALGMSVKPTFLFVAPAVALVAWLERGREARPRPARVFTCGLAGAAITIGVFWYVANLVRFGNPVYPVGSAETVVQPLPPGGMARAFLERLNSLATVAVLDAADHATVQFILTAGWGLAAFACGGVALLAGLRDSGPLRRWAAAFAIPLLAALLLTPPPGFYLRFILFFPALLAVAAARLAEAMPRLAPIVACCGVLTFASTLVPGDLRPSDLSRLTRLPVSERTSQPTFDGVPADAAVACLYGSHFDSNGESSLAYGPGFTRDVFYLREAADPEALVATLKSRNIHWVFTQARSGDGSLRRQVLEATRRGLLVEVRHNLYRLP